MRAATLTRVVSVVKRGAVYTRSTAVRAAFSLMSRSEATDRNEVAVAEEIVFERGDT